MLPSGYAHVSLFTLRPEWHSSREETCRQMRESLLAFTQFPGVRSIEVVVGDEGSTAHVGLVAVYDDAGTLERLRGSEEHRRFIGWASDRFDLDRRSDVNEQRNPR